MLYLVPKQKGNLEFERCGAEEQSIRIALCMRYPEVNGMTRGNNLRMCITREMK